MVQLISDTQRTLLQEAVNTSNAEFIAQCVINIEEILTHIKKLISLGVAADSHSYDHPLPNDRVSAFSSEFHWGELSRKDSSLDAELPVDLEIKEEPSAVVTDVLPSVPLYHEVPVATKSSKRQSSASKSELSKKIRRTKGETIPFDNVGTAPTTPLTIEAPFKCDTCDYTTFRKYRLDDHTLRVHSSRLAAGEIVVPATRSKALMRQKNSSSTKRHEVGKDRLGQGRGTPGSGGLHQCMMCEFGARSLTRLRNHLKSSHNINAAAAVRQICQQQRTSGKRNPVSLLCTADGCEFRAANRTDLRRHFTLLHPALCEVIRCEHCDFSTIKRANYRQHIKIHLAPENKPYKCTQCSYSSANKEGLGIHVNSAHKGVKPYLCDACGQSFTGISMLSKHKLMKHKPKHLSCPHCDYTTSLQTWLKDHMRKHSSDTPFICQFCSYAAKTAGRLKVHLRIHTGERPYRCHLCDYGAMEGAPLKKHLKNQHQLSVQRIDVREGKLFLESGEVLETGLGTRTAPLPAGSFLGNKDKRIVINMSAVESQQSAGGDSNGSQAESSHGAQQMDATIPSATTSIIAQAATLSALPVHPESPNSDNEQLNYTELITSDHYELPSTLPQPAADIASNVTSHSMVLPASVDRVNKHRVSSGNRPSS